MECYLVLIRKVSVFRNSIFQHVYLTHCRLTSSERYLHCQSLLYTRQVLSSWNFMRKNKIAVSHMSYFGGAGLTAGLTTGHEMCWIKLRINTSRINIISTLKWLCSLLLSALLCIHLTHKCMQDRLQSFRNSSTVGQKSALHWPYQLVETLVLVENFIISGEIVFLQLHLL